MCACAKCTRDSITLKFETLQPSKLLSFLMKNSFFFPPHSYYICIDHQLKKKSYLVRPSPFSAQKTFERHNSRRKSNISFCSNINLAAANAGAPNSRRGSGIGLNNMQGQTSGYPSPRAPPLVSTKANSLSLPDSPSQAGQARGRSNSLRVSAACIFQFKVFTFLYFKLQLSDR